MIYKKIVPKDGKIKDYNFQAGTYFIKFRAETDKVCTNWSPALDFRYYNKENTEDENYDDKDDVDIEFGTE